MAETVIDNTIVASRGPKPSLLRQIVDAADTLDEKGQAEILRKIKSQKAAELARQADAMLEGNTQDMTDDEIASIVSEDRKNRYHEKNGY
jgi:hypothetical protein